MIRPAIERKSPVLPDVSSLLQPDEKLVRVAAISPAIYWKGIAVAIFGLILLILPIVHMLGVYFLFVALIILAYAYLMKTNLRLILTDKRVLIRRGIVTIDTVQMRLNRIESVELEWTPAGRILSYAIVVITGTGSRVTAIPFIADGQAFRNDLDALLNAVEERNAAREAGGVI